jgi:hypothetical protein
MIATKNASTLSSSAHWSSGINSLTIPAKQRMPSIHAQLLLSRSLVSIAVTQQTMPTATQHAHVTWSPGKDKFKTSLAQGRLFDAS